VTFELKKILKVVFFSKETYTILLREVLLK